MAAKTSLLNTGRWSFPVHDSVQFVHSRLSAACTRSSCCHRRLQRGDQPAKHISRRPQCIASPVRAARRQKRCSTATLATLQGGLVAEPRSGGGARELLTWISELPWARVAIWATVALTASQFQDFFGVQLLPQLSLSMLCCHQACGRPSFERLLWYVGACIASIVLEQNSKHTNVEDAHDTPAESMLS